MRTMTQRSIAAAIRLQREAGMAMFSVLLLILLAVILAGSVVSLITSGMKATSTARASEGAYAVAQGGLNAALFKIQAGTAPSTGSIDIETYLANALGTAANGSARPSSTSFTGTVKNGSYAVTLSDLSAGDNKFTLTSVGKDPSGRTRTLVALVRADPVAALNYAMFGNQINFHNHNKVTYGVTLNTSMYSNGSILIDRGISIIGPAQAVNAIEPNTGPASGTTSLPNTILSPAGQQGDPNPMTNDPDAPVVQATPAPPIKPFPTFDFSTASSIASTAGRQLTPTQLTTLINHAETYAHSAAATGTAFLLPSSSYPSGVSATNVPVQVIHYKTSSSIPDPRNITVPNGANPNAFIPLGSSDGTSNPSTNTDLYEIDFVGNPLSDTLLYVDGNLTLVEPTTTLLQFQGSLIVNGSIQIHAPTEILAWDNRTGPKFVPLGQSLYTDSSGNSTVATTLAQAAPGQPYDIIYSRWPAIAANGAIKVDHSGFGAGGPVHIEGAVYTVAESHFHKSDAYEASYAVGSEIADTVHNCQWFSFAYDPQAKYTLGFSNKAAGRVSLKVIRIEDRH